MESELDWFKRQHQVITQQQLQPRQEPVVVDLNARVTEGVLRSQLKNIEDELQRETKECQDLRKRVTDREMEIEKSLADLSELRAANLHLRQECDEFRAKFEAAVMAEPKKSEGWFRAPPVIILNIRIVKNFKSIKVSHCTLCTVHISDMA